MDRYLKLLITLFLLQTAANAISQQAVKEFATSDGLEGALISIEVADLETGETLEAFNENQRLCPASVWKLFTTSAALDILGADFKFKTSLAYQGVLSNDTLHGNIFIVGGGDPTLGSRHFERPMDVLMKSWTAAIQAAGIKYIDGQVIANAAHFQGSGIPNTRIWEDMGNYYGGPISGLNIHDNTYFIEYHLPNDIGELAEVTSIYPEVPNLELTSEVIVSEKRGDLAYIFGAPGSNARTVRGTLPAGKRAYTIKGSLPDAPSFAAHQLKLALESIGIKTSSGIATELKYVHEPATLKIITMVSSPPLSQIIQQINTRSDNLFAEALLMQIGVKNGNPTLEAGIEAIETYFASICGTECKIFGYDGSGLSRFTSVSAHQVAVLLVAMNQDPTQKKLLLNSLPYAGKEGSMKWFGKHSNLEGNVQGKSGSMEKVKAYAGQMTAFTGRKLSFVVLVNNFEGSGRDVKSKIEKYLLSVYGDY